METRSRYVLVGLFVLAVTAAGFGFVYWLHNTAGLGDQATYRIRFENAVSGLRAGSNVLFNGMRVGEVTGLALDPKNPKHVSVTIVVQKATPVRADTRVGVEAQGLMGSPSVALRGGTPDAPVPTSPDGGPPMLTADPTAGLDTMQAAREVLRRIDTVLAENAEPLRTTIGNLNTFSGALARNSNRLDTIVEGLTRMLGGGTKTVPTVYDLTAPRSFAGVEKTPTAQLAVVEPTAVVTLDTQRILIGATGAEGPPATDAQWSDSLTKLVQAKLIQSFENAGYARVGRPSDTFTAEKQLLIDIRNFRLMTTPEAKAEIELGAKIVDNGRVVEARIFRAGVPAKTTDAPTAAAALDEAFGRIAKELVPWTLGII